MKFSNIILPKKVIIDDYLPLLVKAEQEAAEAGHIYYRHRSNQGLLELGFDATTQLVHKICLLICKDYQLMNSEYTLPDNCIAGDLRIDIPSDTTTDILLCEIYSNAISIILSATTAVQTIVSDSVAWGIDSDGSLVSVTAYGLSGEATMHAINELSS